jgi:methylated-DNA-[protein]-cysteine S-methyltransferase
MGAPLQAWQARVRTPFAVLGIAANDSHITGVRYLAPGIEAMAPKKNTVAYLACVQIQAYLDDPTFVFDLPLKLSGTHHRVLVWEAMQRIAAGKTRTYGELARELGSSPRAVGGACGANPLPLIVPCHRVVAANDIGGFMGRREEGFERSIKRWLLEHEGAL